MRTAYRTTLLASLLVFNQCALSAEGEPRAAGAKYPRTLSVEELRRLYGERPLVIEFKGAKGNIRYEVFPDGRVFGHNDSLVGSAAAGAGSSDGKWRVDEAAGTICHEWSNRWWTNSCSTVVETEPGSYAWSKRGGSGGLKFTIKPQ